MSRIFHLFAFLLLLCATHLAQAEKYLTVEEAQKLCFPSATSFEDGSVRFTAEQKESIQNRIGTKVKNLGNRLWVARQGEEVLGVLFLDHVIGKHLMIDYTVAVARDGSVRQVEILEYRESHGGQIRGAKWREQFKGKTAGSPLALNRDIYNISGATLSSRNVTEGIKRLLATYEIVVAPRFRLSSRLPDRNSSQN